MERLVRFDWAMKRLLRHKGNYVVLEGFLSTLLGEDLRILRFLESESNQETEDDKFNRVDVLVEDTKGRLIIVEVQNNRELDYFHRILYGVSKTISEYMNLGDDYAKVKKVYSISIVYFGLGQGTDYVYHGKTDFHGLHHPDDVLQLSARQREIFFGKEAGDIFPEYYVLRVDDFDKVAKTPLDEWIRFLKTGEIEEGARAKGLPEARERLRIASLPKNERKDYERHMDALAYQRSVISTGFMEGHADGFAEGKKEGREEGEANEKKKIAKRMREMGMPVDTIAQCTGLASEVIANL